MSYECAKSIARRLRDPVFAERYFVGEAIDVGGGYDSLATHQSHFPRLTSVRTWDVEDGDGQYLATVPNDTYDLVHSSHCLEHLHNPRLALTHWLRVCRPGGHVVAIFPDEDMYEQGVFPSTFNPDHKWTFTLFKRRSWSQRSVDVLLMLSQMPDDAEVLKVESLHHSYAWGLARHDQTGGPAESAIEVVIRKRYPSEVALGGRLPPAPGDA